MLEDIKSHFWHYLILIFIILVSGVCFWSTTNRFIRLRITILVCLAYIFWGIIHHLLEHNLNWKIVVEYSLIGILSAILLGGILL